MVIWQTRNRLGRDTMSEVRILVGDCRLILPSLDSHSFSAVVTSPPYWQARDYGGRQGEVGRCDPDTWLSEIVSCMSCVRRVLVQDGLLWLNLGDRFAKGRTSVGGMEMRDGAIMLLPYRAAIALQQDGWHLRTDIVWNRTNVLPEPVRSRPVRCHETLLMLAHGPDYRYDATAVREPATMKPQRRLSPRVRGRQEAAPDHRIGSDYQRDSVGLDTPDGLRHLRSVWTTTTTPGRHGHPAPFPEALVRTCLLASACPLGSYVLDPFGGSGTTALVAWRMGLSSMLIEVNEDYALAARCRLLTEGVPENAISIEYSKS